MVSASPNDHKYPRYQLVLKLNVTLARPLRLVILYFFKLRILSDYRRMYLYDNKSWVQRNTVVTAIFSEMYFFAVLTL